MRRYTLIALLVALPAALYAHAAVNPEYELGDPLANDAAALTYIQANFYDTNADGTGTARQGQCYFNTTDDTRRCYDGAGWFETDANTTIAGNSTTHIASNGSDHSYIDQDVTIGSSPDLDAANFSGLPTAGSEIAVRKASPGTIAALRPVYETGYNVGGWMLVEEADNSDPAKMPAVGIVTAAVTNSATGAIVPIGLIEGVDTTAWNDGDELYVGAGAALTTTKPTGTALIQKMATVVRDNGPNGVLMVIGAGRSNDVPNIAQNNVWAGDATGVAVATNSPALDGGAFTGVDADDVDLVTVPSGNCSGETDVDGCLAEFDAFSAGGGGGAANTLQIDLGATGDTHDWTSVSSDPTSGFECAGDCADFDTFARTGNDDSELSCIEVALSGAGASKTAHLDLKFDRTEAAPMLASNSWSLMFRMTIDTMSSVASTQVRAMYQSSTNNDDRIFISAFHTGSQRQVRHGFARLGGGGDVNAAMTETADDRWYWLTRNISEFNSGAQFVSSPWTRNRPADWTYAGWATAKDTNVWFRITFEVPNTSALDVSICDIYLTDIPLL